MAPVTQHVSREPSAYFRTSTANGPVQLALGLLCMASGDVLEGTLYLLIPTYCVLLVVYNVNRTIVRRLTIVTKTTHHYWRASELNFRWRQHQRAMLNF